ncbi:MAG: peptidylprolyl isomerase [Gammaproteobacteria bacterium]
MARTRVACWLLVAAAVLPAAADDDTRTPTSMAEVLEASSPGEWRRPDPENTVYFELDAGRVVVELAPAFAPKHAANIRALVRAGYFDGSFVVRSQDNYVVQWGRAEDDPGETGAAEASLPGEYSRPVSAELAFTPLPDADTYAPSVGFTNGLPVARDPATGRTWLVHCYGMVGAGRGMAADSGSGAELYVVIGHSPRHLDRNVTLVGRVLSGMERLSTLPRGRGPLGFYEDASRYVPIRAAKAAADVPEKDRAGIELLKTARASFAALIEVRRTRREEWFLQPTGRLGVCNVPLPVRDPPE